MTKKFMNQLSKYIAAFIVACFSSFCFSYSVEDCESTKASLLQEISDIDDDISFARTFSTATVLDMPPLHDFLVSEGYGEGTYAVMAVDNARYHAERTTNFCDSASIILSSMRSQISDIDCVSCSASSDCPCTNQFASITSYLHAASMYQSFVSNSVYNISNILINIASVLRANTNILSKIRYTLTELGGLDTLYSYFHMYLEEGVGMYPTEWYMGYPTDSTILAYLNATFDNLSFSTASLNNYLYHYIFEEFYPYANHVTNNLITLTDSSTNFFSFFVSSTTARPVLTDYNGVDFPSYHAYLTNFYINVAAGNTAHFTAIQKANTNWFGRIETLIASLVFSESKTNPVDDNSSVYDDMVQEFNDNSTKYKDDLTGLVDSPVGVTRSAVDSFRSLSRAFTDASIPEEVNLVSIPFPDGTQDIKFNPSGSGASAFRCVSTVVWVFTALFLVVQFTWFSFRSISHIVIFIWDVLSMIFGGGK